jgi:ureidoacrylate peracid hydrolase
MHASSHPRTGPTGVSPQVLRGLAAKVAPEHTAVLVIDMQNDFMAPELFSSRLGQDVTDMPELASRVMAFLEVARSHRVPVIHVRADYGREWMSGPMWERLERRGLHPYCQPGTFGFDFYPGLEPKDDERLVTKHRFDAFFGTELDLWLRGAGIQTVIVIGVATHCCVDATARHAYFLDYYVIVGRDLTGGPSREVMEAMFETMDQCFGEVATAEQISQAWSGCSADGLERGNGVSVSA